MLARRRLVQPAVIRSGASSTTLPNACDSPDVSNNPQRGAMATDGPYPIMMTPGTATETRELVERPSASNLPRATVRHLGNCGAPLLERTRERRTTRRRDVSNPNGRSSQMLWVFSQSCD